MNLRFTLEDCGVRRGDIRNAEYAFKAKQYCYATMSELFPRGISPTDCDAAIEINGHFMFMEMKTLGYDLPHGQALFYKRLIRTCKTQAVLLVMEHMPLDTIDVPRDIVAFEVLHLMNGQVVGKPRQINDEDKLRTIIKQWVDYTRGISNDWQKFLMNDD